MFGLGVAVLLWACSCTGNEAPGEPFRPHSGSLAPASALEVYVAPGGSDRNPGTLKAPWRTLQGSMARLRQGQTLWVRGGTYREQIYVDAAEATAKAPILVRPFGQERPVVEGLLWLIHPTHWTIEGIDVTWDPAEHDTQKQMVRIFGGDDWSWKNSEIWGARSFAALNVAPDPAGRAATNWAIEGNCVHDTRPSNGKNQDQLLYVDAGVDSVGGLIQRNLLFDSPNGSAVKLGGPRSDTGTAGVTVRFNTMYRNVRSVLVSWQSRGNEIYDNLMVDPITDAPVRGFQLVGSGNVVRDNAWWGARELIENDPGYRGVEDGGGNLRVDPRFDSTSDCSGFRPRTRVGERYGRSGPGS